MTQEFITLKYKIELIFHDYVIQYIYNHETKKRK